MRNSTLSLRVCRQFYNLINSGKRKIEYKNFNVKWCLRLISNLEIETRQGKFEGIIIPVTICIHKIKYVYFNNANNIYAPILKFEIKKIDIGTMLECNEMFVAGVFFRIHI